MYISLFILFADYGALIIIALCLYILFFASGLGATPWAINSEVLLLLAVQCTVMYTLHILALFLVFRITVKQ
jgi:hypothetical protein